MSTGCSLILGLTFLANYLIWYVTILMYRGAVLISDVIEMLVWTYVCTLKVYDHNQCHDRCLSMLTVLLFSESERFDALMPEDPLNLFVESLVLIMCSTLNNNLYL